MNRQEELENTILGIKGAIKAGEQINANYRVRLAELEKELEQLTSFKRSMGVNTISGMTNSCNIAINAYIPYRENYSGILDILDATFAMIDLANQCNAKFEEDEKQTLWYDSEIKEFRNSCPYSHYTSMVVFNSEDSFCLAVSEIKKSPELTKLAKIFLGVKE